MTTMLGPSVLDTSLCILDLRPRKRDRVLQELVACAHTAGAVLIPDVLARTLAMRERLGSTALGKAVAIPNVRSIAVYEPRVVFGRSARGIEWKAPDEALVHLVFLVLSPGDHTLDTHCELVARVAALARLAKHRARLMEATTPQQVSELLREAGG